MAALKELLLLSGMSGAGRSTALHALEDLGYETIDGLPLDLWASVTTRMIQSSERHALAIGFELSTHGFHDKALADQLTQLRRLPGLRVRFFFFDADDSVLLRRFSETRRRHPLAHDRPPLDGLHIERNRTAHTRLLADEIIDSSTLRPQDLRRFMVDMAALDAAAAPILFVHSFSYKQGLPRSADLVFDVRFLRNPHYEPALRLETGLNEAVGDYIREDAAYPAFFDQLTELLELLLPRYQAEGKSYLSIAFGCTGGRHRSVYLAERFTAWLVAQDYPAQVHHRELERRATGGQPLWGSAA